ncbi:class I SAM-dependent methyltransferase [Streptomyces iconiensis]|uniref:Class I SAM-dependent methyltransferase n=1 Tax=Streptomyces iconiensis TaxID=1384038 RepID=A0ABT7A2D1_9ACTN|nr:class I SAM-dependent methyltransferase [Streptomyces iconiensis]MDJ1134773.1 class I SAM-dependent methyltransferase [Streptomyces iconiensis]
MNSQLDTLTDFYLPKRDNEPNLFQIWEDGGARGDSITPSTYSAAYRGWMRDKLVAALEAHGAKNLLSLGSGNAAIESGLARDGYRVLAVDALAEAVELAESKGLEALQADIADWTPEGSWPVVYMDGVLGHLYDPRTRSIQPVLRRIRSWFADDSGNGQGTGGGTLIASNDCTTDGSPAQPAPGVTGFHWLTGAYMREQALAAGFGEVEAETFTYDRPLSGRRVRSVITARLVA